MRTELERPPRTWVPAEPAPAQLPAVVQSSPLLPTGPLDGGYANAGGLVRPGQYTGHVRLEGDPLTYARADLLISVGYVVAAALTIAGLLLLAALAGLVGWHVGGLVAAWIGGTGIVALVVLYATRRQSQHYSAAGIAHAEVQSRERVATLALRLHARLLLAQLEGRNHERN